MDSSEADLDRIEEQSLIIDVSNDQPRGTCIPMNLINRGANSLGSQGGMSQSGGDSITPPTGETDESVAAFRFSDFFAPPNEDVEMTPEVFSGISYGNKECLKELKSNATSMGRLKSNRGDSILHLAATWGHLELVKEILCEYPRLILETNSEGQTPLHVAAHGGHTACVFTLVAFVKYASGKLCNGGSERLLNPYVFKDEHGNTALHLAIEGHHSKMASCLVDANHDASFLENNKGKSSLYMAVKAGNVSLVKAILETTGNEDLISKLQGRKYLAHVALKPKSIGVLEFILDKYPTLVNERDSKGRTCLSFGAFRGNYDGVCKLLDRSTKSVYVCDPDGSFPTHTAAEEGYDFIVQEILQRCPESEYLLKKLGQNVLHIAAKNGLYWLTRSLMANEDTNLGIGQDMDGNTPLHLAVKNWQSESVSCLTKSKLLKIQNKRGLTAKDIAELELKPNYIYKERWILANLSHSTYWRGLESVDSITRPSKPTDPKDTSNYVNTLLVVAALVATMTFAAGFTMPGGFNSDHNAPDLGRATLATNSTLSKFLILDTLVLQSSLATIGTLIWAQLGDPELIRSSLDVALPLLLFALLFVPLTFYCGMLTVVGHVKWLFHIFFIITLFLFYWAIFILCPHVILQRPYFSPKYGGVLIWMIKLYTDFFTFLKYWIRSICFHTKKKFVAYLKAWFV